MSHSLGVGPSLYLLQLKYLGILFLILSVIGFLPFTIIKPGAMTFGDYVSKYEMDFVIDKNTLLVSCGPQTENDSIVNLLVDINPKIKYLDKNKENQTLIITKNDSLSLFFKNQNCSQGYKKSCPITLDAILAHDSFKTSPQQS